MYVEVFSCQDRVFITCHAHLFQNMDFFSVSNNPLEVLDMDLPSSTFVQVCALVYTLDLLAVDWKE